MLVLYSQLWWYLDPFIVVRHLILVHMGVSGGIILCVCTYVYINLKIMRASWLRVCVEEEEEGRWERG